MLFLGCKAAPFFFKMAVKIMSRAVQQERARKLMLSSAAKLNKDQCSDALGNPIGILNI